MKKPLIWHIGGEDVRMRIPILLKLREMGFDVGAVGSDGASHFKAVGIPFHTYSLNRWLTPGQDRKSVQALRNLFQEHHPQLVHAFDTKPGVLVPIAAKGLGIKVVRTITGMGWAFSTRVPGSCLLRQAYSVTQKRVAPFVSTTIFQNPDDQAYFNAHRLLLGGEQRVILGSGIDTAEFEPTPDQGALSALRADLAAPDQPLILMVARLVRHKGVLEFLKASRAITDSKRPCRFILVGPAASEGRQAVSEAQVRSFGESCTWLGSRTDVQNLLRVSDLFVLPSYYREGLPRVLLEAALSETPSITTDMPGCREVVRHQDTGLLVRPRSAGSLVDAINWALDHPTEMRTLAKRAKALTLDQFSLDVVLRQVAEIYREQLRI